MEQNRLKYVDCCQQTDEKTINGSRPTSMKINYFGEKRQNLKKLFERLQIYSISTFEIKI